MFFKDWCDWSTWMVVCKLADGCKNTVEESAGCAQRFRRMKSTIERQWD